MKIVYQTNRQGVYVGTVSADPSPLEPDVWLIPGGCVETPPPAIPAGMMAVWQETQWTILPLPVGESQPDDNTAPLTHEQTLEQFAVAMDAYVENTARAKGYSSAASLISYLHSGNPAWAAEAKVFIAWRDEAWAFAIRELGFFKIGLKAVPLFDDFISTLPKIQWPQ